MSAPLSVPDADSFLVPKAPAGSKISSTASNISSHSPPLIQVNPEEEQDNDKDGDDDDDLHDASVSTLFPMPNSIQRTAPSSTPSTYVNRRPPIPTLSVPASGLSPRPLPTSSLKPPPSTTNPPKSLMQSSSATARQPVKRSKVALKPGFSAMDWAALRNSGKNLRGVDYPGILRVSPAELKKHKTAADCWTALGGRVYNITPYLPFHPGGEKILLAVAGKDGTSLFMKTHSWVSFESMLDKCLVGMYCP